MYNEQHITVVMPAYNAALTLERTCTEVLAQPFVDDVIIVDDCSGDDTGPCARQLIERYGADRVRYHRIDRNRGYGGNQKTCYALALAGGAEIVVMVHPDYQYTPLLIPAMVSMIGNGLYRCVIGSRILGGGALKGGMPLYKYLANRVLTLFQNLVFGAKLSEYHTGYRAFSAELIRALDLEGNSDDFLFDNQMLAQILWSGATVAEVSCPTKYFAECSSIDFRRSCRYGLGCLKVALQYLLCRMGAGRCRLFPAAERGRFAS